MLNQQKFLLRCSRHKARDFACISQNIQFSSSNTIFIKIFSTPISHSIIQEAVRKLFRFPPLMNPQRKASTAIAALMTETYIYSSQTSRKSWKMDSECSQVSYCPCPMKKWYEGDQLRLENRPLNGFSRPDFFDYFPICGSNMSMFRYSL